ncbi:sugar ABC transporter ATP-binding protein [Oceanivirga salmonicida]|uniref:sugar ABC transporter ATP-binding protein n=1 Tax=Oceanivirga salmonicida TaxID=1769291 RepID=UPI0018CC0C03|nr:sugar ABC transporter ATP-binding protein [Oceanivirga salmonicida]
MKNLIKLDNIWKGFPGNQVLKGINLSLNKGDIKAIIGGNGAGKSTLMKILMGIYKKDSGDIYIKEKKINMTSPSVALENRIYLVPQEPLLFYNMTVEENVIIGFNENISTLKKELKKIIENLGWNIDLNRKADTLSIAEQQLVEILRGLLRKSEILILDEPTSALTFKEVKSFFKIIKDLQNKGIGMLYITHRLGEVFDIATDVVILKDGKIILDGNINEFTEEILIKGLMPDGSNIKKSSIEFIQTEEIGEPIFKVEKLSGYGFNNISFDIYKGEILGLAGVVGSGRTEFAEAIFGKGEILSGDVFLKGKSIKGLNTKKIIKKGLNYVPEDRHLNGLFKMASVKINMTSAILSTIGKIFTNNKKENEVSNKYIEDFRIKVTSGEQEIKSLSGGNQQKVVIGRILSSNPDIVILDEPTRGIDASARLDVYNIIRKLKDLGLAILLISSDFEEIYQLCDKVAIMNNGTNVAMLNRADINMDSLTKAAFAF